MGTIKTTMTADAQQLINEQKRVGQSAAEVNNEYREASRELAQMGRVSSQVFREMQTPLDKYNKQLEALNHDVRSGKISQDEYARAVDHVKGKYDEATTKGGKLSEVMSTLTGHAAGFLSVGAAIGFVGDSIKDTLKEAEDAQQKLRERFVTRGELSQVYGSLAEADAVSAQFRSVGGATTRQMADQNAFAIQSAGLLKDLPTLLQVGGTGLVGSEALPELIGSIKSLRDAFTAAEAGGTEAILSKALVASAISKAPAQKLVQAASKAGAGASALKFSDEETLASIAVLTDPLGSPEEATTRLRALFRAIEKSGIKAGSLGEAVKAIEVRSAAGESFKDIFGSDNAEATEAARLLMSNFGTFTQVSDQINAANSGQVLREKLGMLSADLKQS
ncbi:MAG: hypothetical protein KDB23_32165, partial [Planctomycetales bacterium]|nr:hypothetical protein [Planctomycetales bacterium]